MRMKIRPLLLLVALVFSACSSGSDPVTDVELNAQSAIEDNQTRFLIENAARDGVTVTESGLQYERLRIGTGATPESNDVVTVHYAGTLTDGLEFDSSYARGEPATFPLSGVILGFKEALELMPVGSEYRVVIPPDLAYGDQGVGTQIGPGAVLIFNIELIEINAR